MEWNHGGLNKIDSSYLLIFANSMRYDNNTLIYIDADNPKIEGTSAYNRYELYKKATTIKEAKKLGATAEDIRFDVGKGYIRVTSNSDMTSFNSIIMELIKENKNLTKRLDELELYVKKQNKQNNYIEYLNEIKPKSKFEDFVAKFDNVTEDQFEYLYEMSLAETISKIFVENYDESNSVIKCFEKKRCEFYIYDGEWKRDIDCENMNKLFKAIRRKILDLFGAWEESCFDDGSERVMTMYCEVNLRIYEDYKVDFQKFKNFIFNKYKINIVS